jgi:acetyl esterase/lipase
MAPTGVRRLQSHLLRVHAGGWKNQIQTCHIDRRSASKLAASLPAVCTSVGVRYLPDDPTAAVIARLVDSM